MNLSLLVPLALLFVAACGGEVASTVGATSDDDGGTSALSGSRTAGDGGSSTNIASSGAAAAPSSVDDGSGAGPPVRAGCRRAASLGDAGPDVRVCTVSSAILRCTSDEPGRACNALGLSPFVEVCYSDALTSCPDCRPPPAGTTCMNICESNEYAVYCGGGPPPITLPDGSVPAFIDQKPPTACKPATGFTNTEGESFCCPCE
jgi:hypothetical protein